MNKLKVKWNKIKWKRNQRKLDSGKYKSIFLRQLIIKRSFKPPMREKIIKWIVLFALLVGVSGTKNWQSRAKNKNVVNEAYKKIIDPNFIYFAPAFAFSLVMAFVPILLLVYLVISSNPTINGEVTNMLTKMFGKYAKIFTNTTSTWDKFIHSPTAAFSIIVIIAISSWVSAAGFSKFIFSCSLIYNHDKFGGFWMNRFRGMFVVFFIALYFSLVFSLFTGISIGIDNIPWIKDIPWLFALVNKLLLFLMITSTIYIGICLLFKYAPRFKLKWKHVHPGAVIATIPTSLFLMLFTTITSYTLNYSSIGGNLSYFMTMSMSLLVFSYFIYIGVIANAAFYNINVAKTTRRKATISRK